MQANPSLASHLSDRPLHLAHQLPRRHRQLQRRAVQAGHAKRDVFHCVVACLARFAAVGGQLLPLLRRRTVRLAPSRFRLRLWQPGREEGRRLLVQKHRRVVRPGLVFGRLGHHQSTEGGMHVLGRALAVAAAEGRRGGGAGAGHGGRGRRGDLGIGCYICGNNTHGYLGARCD